MLPTQAMHTAGFFSEEDFRFPLRFRRHFGFESLTYIQHFSQQTSNKAKTSVVLSSDGPFPSASTAHMYTIRQASAGHWYYNLSQNTRLRLLLNGRAQTEPWQCQLQQQTVFLFTPVSWAKKVIVIETIGTVPAS